MNKYKIVYKKTLKLWQIKQAEPMLKMAIEKNLPLSIEFWKNRIETLKKGVRING